jgi:hypothetical protein
MLEQAASTIQGHNPDVLTCIANLSNDEIFTPPELANQMLDTLEQSWAGANDGANIWADKTVTFLDPFTKSGVFLREIARRLTEGLAEAFPDLEERVDHILTKQVYGIGITELTSLLARRSLYCSKYANGPHSIAKSFTTEAGNIWFERTEHTWTGGKKQFIADPTTGREVEIMVSRKCKYCRGNEGEYGRGESLETHAYAFIHDENIKNQVNDLFGEDMQFDVIVGNPPYQLSDEGFGTSAAPIYQLFVEQAKKLDPRFLCMVIPARWFSGGKGLNEFRESMLKDNRLRLIHDYPDSNDVFVGTQIKGGVCHFLWHRDDRGLATVVTHDKGEIVSTSERPLLEAKADVFIRYNEGVSILKKVMSVEASSESKPVPFSLSATKKFSLLVSSRKPFGFDTKFKGGSAAGKNRVLLYRNGGTSYVSRSEVKAGKETIDKWKIFIPRAGSGSDSFPHPILGKPFVGEPGSVSSETYLCLGPFSSKKVAKNVGSYISTRLFRFLVLLHKPTQDATRSVYTFVPTQDFSRSWSDEELYAKYNINEEEIEFIESMIRPMDLSDE